MRAKALVFDENDTAKSIIGSFAVHTWGDGWMARYCRLPGHVMFIGNRRESRADAIAACQAEFERIWREMTDMGLDQEPDMFWDDADPEMSAGPDELCMIFDNYRVGDLVELQRAFRLPNQLVEIIETQEPGCDPCEDYRVVATGDAEIATYRAKIGEST